MDELLEILNPDGTGTGIAKSRKQIKQDGDWHRIVSIWIQNSDSNFLMQKRVPRGADKTWLWATTGGHVQFGDTTRDTIIREIREEIWFDLLESEISHFFTQKIEYIQWDQVWRVFRDVWYVKKDIKITDLIYQKEEVQMCEWISPEWLKKILWKWEVFNYGEEYLEKVFSLEKK